MTSPVQPLRVRMFAGPNGSGKTTVQRELSRQFGRAFLGVLVNPDELEEDISRNGRLALEPFRIHTTEREVRDVFRGEPGTLVHLLVKSKDGATHAIDLTLADYV